MTTYFYFTRHGETEWNTKKLMQGWRDSSLTEKGVRQAELLSDRLSNLSIQAIYSSTSGRAVTTGEIIRRGRPTEVKQLDSLKELSFGVWEGKTFTENEQNDPEGWGAFWETPHLFSSETVESFIGVQERMIEKIYG